MSPAVIVLDGAPRSRRSLVRAFANAHWRVFMTMDADATKRVLDEEIVDALVVRFDPARPSEAIAALVRARHAEPDALRVLISSRTFPLVTELAQLVVVGSPSAPRIVQRVLRHRSGARGRVRPVVATLAAEVRAGRLDGVDALHRLVEHTAAMAPRELRGLLEREVGARLKDDPVLAELVGDLKRADGGPRRDRPSLRL